MCLANKKLNLDLNLVDLKPVVLSKIVAAVGTGG